jgi:hypothetical protein
MVSFICNFCHIILYTNLILIDSVLGSVTWSPKSSKGIFFKPNRQTCHGLSLVIPPSPLRSINFDLDACTINAMDLAIKRVREVAPRIHTVLEASLEHIAVAAVVTISHQLNVLFTVK